MKKAPVMEPSVNSKVFGNKTKYRVRRNASANQNPSFHR